MAITMVITMGTMDNTATNQKLRRISHISPASSARRLDTLNCTEAKSDELANPNPFQKGQVNHINVEEVMNEPDAVMGMFPLNTFRALYWSIAFIHIKNICKQKWVPH
jgi:hypothetical protein